MSKSDLNQLHPLAIKIGSSLLIVVEGRFHRNWLQSLSDDIADLRHKFCEALIMSSGVVVVGSKVFGIDWYRARLEGLLATVATGQVQLIYAC